jgi:hypothetical protein
MRQMMSLGGFVFSLSEGTIQGFDMHQENRFEMLFQ